MGMLTVVVIHHDYVNQIETDPSEFTSELLNAIRSNTQHPLDLPSFSGAFIMPCHHSQDSVLYLMAGNTLVECHSGLLRDTNNFQKFFKSALEAMGITWRPKWAKK